MILTNQTVELNVNNGSFSHLTAIGIIRLSHSIAIKCKCLFVNFGRNYKQNIRNKFKFYESLNLITDQGEEVDSECDML